MTELQCALTTGDYEWAGVARQRKREEKARVWDVEITFTAQGCVTFASL